jgi:hypothetical protein
MAATLRGCARGARSTRLWEAPHFVGRREPRGARAEVVSRAASASRNTYSAAIWQDNHLRATVIFCCILFLLTDR